MIRARLRSNGWVLAELFLVFIVMWFLCDSLGCLKYTFYRPLGYNIDHVYQLSMITGGESRDSSMTNADKYLSILQKLEREPAVEVAALSYWSLPMSGNNSYNSLAVQDTIGCELRIINATGGYTRVFRMKEDIKRSFAAMPVGSDVTSGNYVMLSEGAADYYKERVPGFSLDTPLNWYGDSTNVVTQCGMIGSFRSYRYGADAKWVFRRIDENVIRTELRDYGAQIVFRVKENMDSPDYRSKFLKEIAPHLDTDNMFIADVVPYTEQQYQFEVMKGDVDKVNTQTVVVLFLLVNVFLGLIGTFWFRTRRRRNEIALRLAMGSTKKQIFCLLMGEGLLLLTLVALPAMLVCYNVGVAEFIVVRSLFGTTDAVGREFLLNHAPYRVAGVVKDVSTLADCAYGQVWVPYTSTGMDKEAWNDRHMGLMSCTMLAHSRDDFPAIRQEAERRKLEYNTLIGKDGWELIYRNRPYDQEKNAIAFGANIEPDVDAARRQRIMIFVILLIVPAINLSSMTQSRLRQRVSEIGVRRAFGSTRAELMGQIIAENLVVTLLAGIVGLLLSVAFAYMGNTLLFAQEFSQTLNPPEVDASILLHASTFAWALLFCFVLNLMSSGFPAWCAARIGIVNALGGRLH